MQGKLMPARSRLSVMLRASLLMAALLAFAAAARVSAQTPAGDSMSNRGVERASAVVDSVFVDRSLGDATVGGGDFASYLMARLGVLPIPPDLRFRVAVDSQYILLNGRVADLPAEAAAALGPLLGMFPPETMVAAYIDLQRAAPDAVRFRLTSVSINGLPVPDPMLQSVMTEVGRQYPALTRTGRDLFVRIPATAEVSLVPDGVHLIGPLSDQAAGQ